MMNVQNFFNSVFDLQGKLSEKIQTIKGYKDDASDTKHNDTKAIATVGLILDLAAEMQSGATSMNFFLQGRQALMLPFEIAGKTKDLPESVFSTDGKVARILTPEAWFGTTDGLAAVKELIGNDSNGYLEKIANNVDKIVKDSTRNAISYYGTWFIVDTGHLVSESVTGVNYSVRDSLALIYKYLDGLIKRADGDSSMGVLMSNVADTMRRIQKILIEYDKADYLYKNEVKPFLAALVNENRKRYRLNKSSPAYFSFLGGVKGSCRPNDSSCTLETQLSDTNLSAMFNKVADYNTKIVTTVYDELNVLLSRSSFLSNRLAVFVEADFLSQIRNNKDISLFEKDFYTATGVAEYELLMSSFNKNPDAAKQDLAQALVLHKQTLLALETLFKNSMVQHIARLRRQSNNLSVSPNAMTIDSARRLLNDVDPAADNPVATAAQRQILAKERYSINPVTGAIRLFETGAMGLVKKMTQSDRYEMDPELPIYERPVGVTDELSSHKTIYQKLCVQALAFIDQAIFRNLCSDVVLKSVLTSKQKTHADPKVRTYLERTAVSWLEKQREGSENRQIVQAGKFAAYNHSIRVCAYRDFLRNSKVLSLTSGQNITRYDPRKTKQIDEMINTIIEADRASEAAEVQRRQNAEAEPTTPEAYEAEQPQTLQPPKPRSALPRPAGKE
jgi:hypothetical protein